MRKMFYGNSPAAASAARQWGNTTMAYMGVNVASIATISQLHDNDIYVNAGLVNGMTTYQQEAMLLHELLHNITGQTDDVIQEELNLPTSAGSQNIGDKLQADCFKRDSSFQLCRSCF
jgi:hypothetical protein